MRNSKEEPSCSTAPTCNLINGNQPVLDLISVVKGLHGLGSLELGKLIKEAENNIIQWTTEDGVSIKVDAEKVARYLALHLIAVIMAWKRDAALFEYLLSGFCLLHSLYDLAPRHPKIEQILLDDVKVSEQLIDLIFFSLTIVAAGRPEHDVSNHVVHLYSTLAASCLYLLTACISSQMQELVQVLLAYSKVDIFMDAAFAAVCVAIKFLRTRLLEEDANMTPTSRHTAHDTLNHLCQQCEASLQFLQSLCQQKLFRERVVKNKEFCGKGGVLLLVYTVLNLNLSKFYEESSAIVAAVSRMKSKVLSILLHLCEAESVSYLDVVASNSKSLNLAKSIALEVLGLLKEMFRRDFKQQLVCSSYYPKGQLQLNAMRLADMFSDDSNFRSYITTPFTEVLTAIISLPYGEFLSSWCSSELPELEEDTTLDYEPFSSAGWVLNLFTYCDPVHTVAAQSTFIPCNIPRASYAHQRTSLLVKVIANLHCFAPHICKEDKDFFLNKFHQCLQKEVPNLSNAASAAEKAVSVSRNLSSLLAHAESLIPGFLNEEDVQLLRVFMSQLESLIELADVVGNQVQDAPCKEGCSSPVPSKEAPDHDSLIGDLKQDLSKAPAFQKFDQFNMKSNGTGQCSDVGEQGRSDESKYDTVVPKVVREVEKDAQNVEASGSDSSSARGKHTDEQIDEYEPVKWNGYSNARGDKKMEIVPHEEKLHKKRKRTIMNDQQISMIEKALMHETDMHRNATSLQLWAERLSSQGSEVTAAQLKNWLNNRKARLARSAKDSRLTTEGDNIEKVGAPGVAPSSDTLTYRFADNFVSSKTSDNVPSGKGDDISRARSNENPGMSRSTSDNKHLESIYHEPGDIVMVLDENAKDIGKGKVYQVQGFWYGNNLRESGTCVVDIIELTTPRFSRLPYPSEFTGTSFDQAEKRLGLVRVLWESNKLARLPMP